MSGYRTDLKPVWCSGCGYYGVLKALTGALEDLAVPKESVGLFSGIGCAARIAGYMDVYGFNLLHGRAVPTAIGAKLAKPELTVLAIGGDGDIFSIGGGHLSHAVRENRDITVVCLDNFVYGLTKGQSSPTTPQGSRQVAPIDPVFSMIAYSTGMRRSFIAQGISSDHRHLKDLLVRAIRHRGFSFVNVLSSCVTYRKAEFDGLKGRCLYLDGSHDPGDYEAALRLAETPTDSTPHLGVFFEGSGR